MEEENDIMKPSDLDILILEGEGTTLEYKESLSASFAREVVALANTAGGRILLGVADDGSVKGIPDSNELRARIQDIARNCDPPVKVLVERVGKVTAVIVRESNAKPVQCRDGFFWRQGAVTQKLSRNEIREFFRAEGSIRFDLSPCPAFRYPEDFDEEKYLKWLRLSGITGHPRTEDVLVNIEAAEHTEDRLLFRNAGVLFFAKNVRHFFNQAYITCLLAKGDDKAHVLDRKDFDNGIVADIEDAMRFVERNTRTAWRIEGLRREDISEYPIKALREAITNAVMHRDWFVEGANVFVELYTNRIEVSSPGGLPKGMRLADLGRKSIRRNALIADLLHRVEFIEKAGTGIRRMRGEARELGCSEPEFEETGFFTILFRPNPAVRAEAVAQEKAQSLTQLPIHSDDPVIRLLWALRQGVVTPEVAPEVTPEVTPEVRTLEAKDWEMSRQALQAALGLKDAEHFRKAFLLPALDTGLVEMTIPDKPRSSKQRYRLTAAGRKALKKLEES